VRRRLAVYERDTRPLVEYYRQRGLLEEISGAGAVTEIFEAVLRATEGCR
jgi:adenylate kinase